jgi:hypothetical protein
MTPEVAIVGACSGIIERWMVLVLVLSISLVGLYALWVAHRLQGDLSLMELRLEISERELNKRLRADRIAANH